MGFDESRILGIGIDLVDIPRIAEVRSRHGDHFLKRVFVEGERDYCLRQKDPDIGLAARFAAKEAALKALGKGWTHGMRWTDFEVMREPGGRPVMKFHGAAATLAHELGVKRAHLSVSRIRGGPARRSPWSGTAPAGASARRHAARPGASA